jgi:hypothetical protein
MGRFLSFIGSVVLGGILILILLFWAANKIGSERRAETAPAVALPPMEDKPASTPQEIATSTVSDSSQSKFELSDDAKDAMKGSPDVVLKAIGPGAVLVTMEYGVCGTIQRRVSDYIWHPDSGINQAYPDLSSAVIYADTACEGSYREAKALHEAQTAYPSTPSSQP